MDEQETPSAKEAMEAVRALSEMMTMFKACNDTIVKIFPLFVKAAEGNGVAMFEGMDKVSDLDVDDAQGCLIVALSIIAKIKVAVKGTPCEETVREIFTPKES